MKIDIFSPDKKYDVIYADPPWKYQNKTRRGACEFHYETMSLKDICDLPVHNITSENCVLFLWVTYPMLFDALRVIDAWGFKYKTIGFQWVKQNKSGNGFFFGLGSWTRGNTECCLLAVKGRPKRVSSGVSQLIVHPIQKHSKKPDEVRDKIVELLGEIPRIELFAREETPGWDCWGNEV